jgi:hypothetical protein
MRFRTVADSFGHAWTTNDNCGSFVLFKPSGAPPVLEMPVFFEDFLGPSFLAKKRKFSGPNQRLPSNSFVDC